MAVSDILEQVDARGVATLTLNRPDRHNAFDDALVAALTEALQRMAAAHGVRVVVLASTGASFSAGADLTWMRRMARQTLAANLADAAGLAELMRVLDRLAKPTVAVVQGPAYGGGVGLIACCDIAIASEKARFSLSEVRLGLTPATISPYVVRAIGARQARRYFQTAELFSAAQAHAFGLVHEVVAHDDLTDATQHMLAAILHGAPGAQADAKDLVFLCQDDPTDLIAETGRRIAERRASPEGQEGIAAFLDKRSPAWRAG